MIPPSSIPTSPGVYLFKNAYDTIIYVGKAKNLRKRVSSYFRSSTNHSIKTQFLVKNIQDVEFILVDNEVEALLLENKLIKKHSPKYNIHLKDAKTFAYIAFSAETFPKIYSTRKVTKKGNYFGPYTDGSARWQLQRLAVELFKLRTCRTLPKRACLNYHIGLCTAPCIGKVSPTEYAAQVDAASTFLKGDSKDVLKRLETEMKTAAQKMQYEIALKRRQQIEAITHLHEKQHVDLLKRFDQDVVALVREKDRAAVVVFSIQKGVIQGKKEFRLEDEEELFEDFITTYYAKQSIPHEIIVNEAFWDTLSDKKVLEAYLSRLKGASVKLTWPQRGEKVSLVELALKNAKHALENKLLKELQETLNLPSLPEIVECFDISNLGREHIVAGMTQWVFGKEHKAGHRKFEIRSTKGHQDDFASMREVILRRYKHLKEHGLRMPDLILIDGGPGQLSAALESLQALDLQIPTISLAKREEEIYLPFEETPRNYDSNSPMMLLLRRMRDSVHRYVLAYNRKKRQIKLREETKET